MAEIYKYKRIIFPEGQQQIFLSKIFEKISLKDAAVVCGTSERTLRDWKREKFSMDATVAASLCEKVGIAFPREVELRDRYWYVTMGASAGGKALMKKYGKVGGDEEYRKKKWKEWWNSEGHLKPHPHCLPRDIRKPSYSEYLAEFVGILLGNGGISEYQIIVTLHAQEEKEYAEFVHSLIKDLFNVSVKIFYRQKYSVVNLVVSRVELVRFCVTALGLKKGNKVTQQIDIPFWIKEREHYSIACIKGLIDTDGSIFTHRYKSKGKEYTYKKMLFTSHSEPLRQSVYIILRKLNIKARLDNHHNVWIDNQLDVRRYFRIISSHNLKHLKRYQN